MPDKGQTNAGHTADLRPAGPSWDRKDEAGFGWFRPVSTGFGWFGPADGLWGRGKSNGPRADGAVKYRMGPWAPVMLWGIEWAPGPGPWAPVMPWGIEWAPGPGPGLPAQWYFLSCGIF